ncbi:Histone deacetylase complex subunit [Dimargaris verticillata]|uniref:Histone deacetylase complex subunit n=1 Tax=Dimargaris verticillata TaxID=2761393 RepID=A0A9W8EBH6_9FUNG|nr:Histone deacetylase complex subunit [Dimargaris verticillata]
MGGRSNAPRRGQRQRGSQANRATYSADVTRCVCGGKQDDGQFMIQCDVCKVWQHGECVNLPDQTHCPDSYYCEQCRPEDHPYLLFATKRTNEASALVAPTESKPPRSRKGSHSSGSEKSISQSASAQPLARSRKTSTGSARSRSSGSRANRPKGKETPPQQLSLDTASVTSEPLGQSSVFLRNTVPVASVSEPSSPRVARRVPPSDAEVNPPPQLPNATPMLPADCDGVDAKRAYESDSDMYNSTPTTANDTKKRRTSTKSPDPAEEYLPVKADSEPMAMDVDAKSVPAAKGISAKKRTGSSQPTSSTSSRRSTKGPRKPSSKAKPVRRSVSEPGDGLISSDEERDDVTTRSASSTKSAQTSLTLQSYTCQVSYPTSNMSMSEMMKRTHYILDYITRVQVDLADHKSVVSVSGPSTPAPSAADPIQPPKAPPSPTVSMLPQPPLLSALSPASQASTEEPRGSAQGDQMSSMQLIDILTRDLIKFQETYTT